MVDVIEVVRTGGNIISITSSSIYYHIYDRKTFVFNRVVNHVFELIHKNLVHLFVFVVIKKDPIMETVKILYDTNAKEEGLVLQRT